MMNSKNTPYEFEGWGRVVVSVTGQWHSQPHPVASVNLSFDRTRNSENYDPGCGWWWPDVVIYPVNDSGGWRVKYRTSQGSVGPFDTLKEAERHVNEDSDV